MTMEERNKIKNAPNFESLWKEMWCKNNDQENNRNFNRELVEATRKFNLLKNGVYIKCDTNTIFCDLNYVLENSNPEYNETEWGFPKGRRNINEEDIACAFREFREETGIHARSIRLCTDIKPCEEIFSGTNKIRYKHIYYVTKFTNSFLNSSHIFDPSNKQQCKEIKDAKWFSYTEAQDHIRDMNVERKELLKRVNGLIMKSNFVY
jgi:8-oxo-dGTP pyrophosphatase MutT (NUDIX family)